MTGVLKLSQAYETLVSELKETGIPFAENAWNTRPKADHYGVVALEFEAGAMNGDNRKMDRAIEGSVDLFSKAKNGGGYPAQIEEILDETCEGAWKLNHHGWESDTGLFHWEWAYQVEG